MVSSSSASAKADEEDCLLGQILVAERRAVREEYRVAISYSDTPPCRRCTRRCWSSKCRRCTAVSMEPILTFETSWMKSIGVVMIEGESLPSWFRDPQIAGPPCAVVWPETCRESDDAFSPDNVGDSPLSSPAFASPEPEPSEHRERLLWDVGWLASRRCATSRRKACCRGSCSHTHA